MAKNKVEIGETLREIRKRNKVSANDVSVVAKGIYGLNISHKTIERYERGEVYPSVEYLQFFARHFRYSIDFICGVL
jgi:transcriptional regulator with XRE-family HTH domain